jgi:hypothetical protein
MGLVVTTRFSKGEAMDQLLRFPGINSWLECHPSLPPPRELLVLRYRLVFFRAHDHWTAADEIGGETVAAAAIFTPDALMFFVSLGTGRIWYGDDGFMSGVHCEARENWIAEFDPADIVKVWRGTLAPWEPKPTWSYLGGPGRAAGRALGWVAAVGRASLGGPRFRGIVSHRCCLRGLTDDERATQSCCRQSRKSRAGQFAH